MHLLRRVPCSAIHHVVDNFLHALDSVSNMILVCHVYFSYDLLLRQDNRLYFEHYERYSRQENGVGLKMYERRAVLCTFVYV